MKNTTARRQRAPNAVAKAAGVATGVAMAVEEKAGKAAAGAVGGGEAAADEEEDRAVATVVVRSADYRAGSRLLFSQLSIGCACPFFAIF